ncbi:MAG: hypothetical protein HYU42_04525 [Candidatus Rokubacteria bacterium]|nr:hypothetical protein [Candidatus Rokubacteria bacterium]MBI2197851.1 hypothetical protein [Candidatus Rokubacteria bacterium]MBI3105831.1 hypothetical protein [Candidatus Rokubacteria bacterium]
MSISPHARREPSSTPSTSITHLRAAGVILVLLLAAFPLLAMLPNDVAGIRVAGLSILWWYGGVLAPLAATAVATLAGGRGAAETPFSPDAPAAGASSARPPDLS